MSYAEVLKSSHQSQTTMPCIECGQKVIVKRSCHQVYVYCPQCDKNQELNDYVSKMDDALEKFMENVYCNRI